MKNFSIQSSEIQIETLDQISKIGGSSANFSQHFNLKKIGVHHQIIPPNFRTSKPHAESAEEEFVYVISGEIDLWFNGKIKKMIAGDCVGFKSGTGIGHCLINNSKKNVELFVVGERTKQTNQYHFHLETELSNSLGDRWWTDMPKQVLGAHDGMPGSYSKDLIDESIFVFNHNNIYPEASFSYPNDHETFGHGICLSRKFNLSKIAVWIEKLPTGKRSSWPHAHSHEEEFIFVLGGSAHAWLDENLLELKKNMAVDFRPGSGVAHTIINNSGDDFFYLCVGECEVPEDKIYYPQHPLRNIEMKEKNAFWENRPIKLKE